MKENFDGLRYGPYYYVGQIILVNGVPSRIGKKRSTLFIMYGRVRQKALQQFSSRCIIKI